MQIVPVPQHSEICQGKPSAVTCRPPVQQSAVVWTWPGFRVGLWRWPWISVSAETTWTSPWSRSQSTITLTILHLVCPTPGCLFICPSVFLCVHISSLCLSVFLCLSLSVFELCYEKTQLSVFMMEVDVCHFKQTYISLEENIKTPWAYRMLTKME